MFARIGIGRPRTSGDSKRTHRNGQTIESLVSARRQELLALLRRGSLSRLALLLTKLVGCDIVSTRFLLFDGWPPVAEA